MWSTSVTAAESEVDKQQEGEHHKKHGQANSPAFSDGAAKRQIRITI
jgi:hypothetical protein